MKVDDVEVEPCGCGEPWNGDWDWGKRRDKTGPQFICAGCGARGEVQTEKRDAALAWNAMWAKQPGPATRELVSTLNWVAKGADRRFGITVRCGDVEEYVSVDLIEEASAECGLSESFTP